MPSVRDSRKLLFVVNVAWFFRSHRLPIAEAARKLGFDVHVACNTEDREAVKAIQDSGCTVHEVPFSRGKMNPMRELRVIFRLLRVYRSVRPALAHHVTIKPVLYGSLIARLTGVPAVVNAISGLGHTFSSAGKYAAMRRSMVRSLYRVLLGGKNTRVILQNPDDVKLFVEGRFVAESRVVLIRGSGVDLSIFKPGVSEERPLVVIFPARMLWAKGVAEFVDAAARVHSAKIQAHFVLAGAFDPENPGHVPKAVLEEFAQQGHVSWAGHLGDVAGAMAKAAVICLPSYYGEGVPKALIEAAASGKPIVTTDMPGCREVVRDGWNGILVPIRDGAAVANALIALLSSEEMRQRFGENSRRYAEMEFGIESVVEKTLSVYRSLLEPLHAKSR